ncbi:MAG: adenylate/guanylate cyclase domain-containing protein [Aestuariivirga sp.]
MNAAFATASPWPSFGLLPQLDWGTFSYAAFRAIDRLKNEFAAGPAKREGRLGMLSNHRRQLAARSFDGKVMSLDGQRAAIVLERAQRAVLFIDVVESVRLIEEFEDEAISRWMAIVDFVKQSQLSNTGGRIVKSTGDGMLLEFPDVRKAAAAAFAIQRESAEANAGTPPEQRMHLRMGIEVSAVIVGRDDLYGHGVNLAARLMSLAGPGEIVVSAGARELLTASLDAEVEDLGNCYLKNVSEPVRAFRIGPLGPRPVIRPVASLKALRPALAIIPFTMRAGAGEHAVLGEILAEEMIRSLSRTQEFNVISRLSTTAFSGRNIELTEIGGHLHANYVVSGSFRTDGSTILLDAELADAKSGHVVWAERLKDRTDSVLLEDPEIVSRVVAGVCSAVMTRELQRARSQSLPTLESYTLLMGAITLMHRFSLQEFNEAHAMLEAILSRGVRQSMPQAWLARWHVLRVQQGWSENASQDAYRAMELTKLALDTDPESSLALAVDGLVQTNLLKRFDLGRQRFELAVTCNPNDSLAHLLKGLLHTYCDEGEQAVAETELARKLSPFDPHRAQYDSLAASAYITAGQYENALEMAKLSLRGNRVQTSTWRALAVAQWQLGMHEEARKSVAQLMTLEPQLTIGSYLRRAPSANFKIGKTVAGILRQAGVPE